MRRRVVHHGLLGGLGLAAGHVVQVVLVHGGQAAGQVEPGR